MSLTTKALAKFWQRMAEKYGTRWAETHGAEPNATWREMLNKYTPQNIADALELLVRRPALQQHPPTEPQFEALIIDAIRAKGSGLTTEQYRRGYWRSVIIGTMEGLMGYGTEAEEFEQLVVSHKETLGAQMRRLLDEMDELESKTGQRTPGMEEHCLASCLRIRLENRALIRRDETAQPQRPN